MSTQDVSETKLNAEKAALGCVLLEPSLLGRLEAIVRPEDFGVERHRILFEHLRTMSDSTSDFAAIIERLRGDGALDAVGGMTYLVELARAPAATEHAECYARRMIQPLSQQDRDHVYECIKWLDKAQACVCTASREISLVPGFLDDWNRLGDLWSAALAELHRVERKLEGILRCEEARRD
ncbi:MAG: DnaB-like helicase N-terminal domain-containing protein [Novosphingobium sp.]